MAKDNEKREKKDLPAHNKCQYLEQIIQEIHLLS